MNTNKKMFFMVLLIIVLALLTYGWAKYMERRLKTVGVSQAMVIKPAIAGDYRNIAYIFNGRPVQLINGTADELAAPGSASRITTTYFGNDLTIDLNKDGRPDTVFYITQSTGGSGMFYYVAAALNTENGYVGSEAYFVGDRIAPQAINSDEKGVVLVNYADRKKGQPFSAQPSEGKTLRLKLDIESMRFGIVADIPGEADPARMTLDMKTWRWQSSQLSDKTLITPKQMDRFSLLFTAKNQITVGTDCNRVGGEYVASDGTITFKQLVSTEMFCENSQESIFVKELTEVTNYLFTDRGELRLILKNNGGTMIFK